MSKMLEPEELAKDIAESPTLLNGKSPEKEWMDTPAEFREGNWAYSAKTKAVQALGMPNVRDWSPGDEDWKLPENWKEIISEGFRERLDKFRSFKIYMDICVRCGACADKCHFFLGSGDPKNMPVLRAELLRSVYRNDFTLAGKLLKKYAGARPLTMEVVKEWFLYFFQCTECRRCSVFCPYGIDTAEITIMARELLNLVGININWIMDPAANCNRTGNHLGIEPHTFKTVIESLCDDIEEVSGVRINPPFNKKGAEILFITPSGDVFADPGVYTMMGYIMLFEHIGLDYTLSTYASEGGNFGLFNSNELMKKLNAKMYHEADRLGVKWILGGECGHMWRVVNQYMDTMNGPSPGKMEEPVSPITGTKFENAKSTKMVHIMEFTADLIRNNKLKLDPSRNDHRRVTFHDSCNPARAMGLLDEPRYVINNVCNNFFEMPENTIRENTFCCGAGSGLNTEEIMDVRMRGAFPRASALKHVEETHDVNMMACVCAIDRATLLALTQYWAPDVEIAGVTELVANALVMEGENEDRDCDLREDPYLGVED
ncbi:(Fe-S)-binding protein [bacterium]|nr:(Fe-S)-binding protein [bacterium]